MKKVILGLSCFMMAALMFGTIIYFRDTGKITYSQFETDAETNNEEILLHKEPLQKSVTDKPISYALQKNALLLTFNAGKSWTKVPVEIDQLFSGSYNGDRQELIDGSYVLGANHAAFISSSESVWNNQEIQLVHSFDKGRTWRKSVVTKSAPPSMRFRKVGFLNDEFGYIIISGDRTMSQEMKRVFLTHDGGMNWEEAASPDTAWMIADGGFVDPSTGFMSVGSMNPLMPELYVTQDGGGSWDEAVVHIPDEYKGVFVSAEVPIRENDQLTVLINQGQNGDYLGGRIKGKFISRDNGKTWTFLKEVQPDDDTE